MTAPRTRLLAIQLVLPFDSAVYAGELEAADLQANMEYILPWVLWMMTHSKTAKGEMRVTFVEGIVTRVSRLLHD